MASRISSWNFYCSSCDYWSADLPYDISSENNDLFNLDQEKEEAISFLNAVRTKNFNILLNQIKKIFGDKPLKILDIGCATGLFIQMASSRGHHAVGIEPNPKMASISKNKGLNVINGYFPEAIENGELFDLIIFNDVFEHIPELSNTMAGLKDKLKTDGLLIINLPTSDGFLFHLGKILYKLRITTLWDRLWQKMFYTPHLHYFNVSSLNKWVAQFGFDVKSKQIELDVLSISGLWKRISVDKNNYFLKNLVVYCAVLLLNPLLRLFPKDTVANFYATTHSSLLDK